VFGQSASQSTKDSRNPLLGADALVGGDVVPAGQHDLVVVDVTGGDRVAGGRDALRVPVVDRVVTVVPAESVHCGPCGQLRVRRRVAQPGAVAVGRGHHLAHGAAAAGAERAVQRRHVGREAGGVGGDDELAGVDRGRCGRRRGDGRRDDGHRTRGHENTHDGENSPDAHQ
jgi:hypothetical protein